MLTINFSEKGLGPVFPTKIFCMVIQEKYFSCYILLIDQISLSDRLYFSRYWAMCVLQLLVKQVVTSKNLKLTLYF